jgi:hypothetical protein
VCVCVSCFHSDPRTKRLKFHPKPFHFFLISLEMVGWWHSHPSADFRNGIPRKKLKDGCISDGYTHTFFVVLKTLQRKKLLDASRAM